MSCCCNKPPVVRLTHNSVFLANISNWNDNNICRGAASRQMRWSFRLNGHLVYQTPYGLPTDTLGIGTNSTYQFLNATALEISEFIQAQGETVQDGDIIGISFTVRNCQNETTTSNIIRIVAILPDELCDCSLQVETDSGQTGNLATAPSGFTTSFLVFRNGLLNYAGLDFSADPLVSADELLFMQLTGCAASLRAQTVTGATGNVPLPSGAVGLSASQFLLFRNGLLQRAYTVSGSNAVPSTASEAADRWLFVSIQDSTVGCTFGVRVINSSFTGSTFALPSGFTAANQDKWLPVVNGVVLSPGVGYTVSGSNVTLTTAAAGDEIWIIVIE